ncbi:hypothetical protein DSM104299_04257 [Baekduia alba]|uniref:helix-turn-helix domain-containing protein n=1 Tax=Baekduia alba TaxID=2997333 RepID=UPI002340FDF1|nr:helix-turn-helix domain-containing protein [Baekduia alba]WCB95509.1 hypothetical protein DSM104299_04257 [Baekduia alba]
MSGLVTFRHDLGDDVTRVKHARCGAVFTIAEVDDDISPAQDGSGKLLCERCESERAGAGYGFMPVRRRSALERAGGKPYGPLPWWFARGEGLHLSPTEFRLVVALWGFQGEHEEARPTLATLAALCERGERHVGRVLDSLVERGLILRWRRSRRQAYRYDVGPLVRGEVVAGRQPSADTDVRTRDAPSADTDVRSDEIGHDASEVENVAPGTRVRTSTSSQTGHQRPHSVRTSTSGEEELAEEELQEEDPTSSGRAGRDFDDEDAAAFQSLPAKWRAIGERWAADGDGESVVA